MSGGRGTEDMDSGMKIEYLQDGSDDCPLVRIFDFTADEAQSLRQAVRELGAGRVTRINLSELQGIEPVDGLDLAFVAGEIDAGLVRDHRPFCWILSIASWHKVADKIEPFVQGSTGYQWLSECGETSLLISPTGRW